MAIYIPIYEDDCAPGVREMNLEFCKAYCRPEGRVLDMGAGGGRLSSQLRDSGFEVTAVDLKEMAGESFSGVHCLTANLDDGIPAAEAQYDAVICQDVIHQLENPWFAFREVRRVLMDGGVFILSAPNMNHLFVKIYELLFRQSPHFLRRHYEHARTISPLPLWSAERMAEHAGFHNLVTTYNMNYLPVARWKLPGRTQRFGHTMMLVFRADESSTPSSDPVQAPRQLVAQS